MGPHEGSHVWFQLPDNTKVGIPRAVLSACSDVEQKEEEERSLKVVSNQTSEKKKKQKTETGPFLQFRD